MWEIIFRTSNFFYPEKKICRNIVSFSHSFLTVCLIYFNVNFSLIIVNSVSYFIWDIIHMFEHNSVDYLYVYHHLSAILMFLYNSELIKKILFNAELSNFPTYLVYHKLKLGKSCDFEKIIQLVWFFYFRIIVFTKFVFMYYENNFILNNLVGIYLLGIFWFFNQLYIFLTLPP